MKNTICLATFILSFFLLAAICLHFTWVDAGDLAPREATEGPHTEDSDNKTLFDDEALPPSEDVMGKKEPAPVYRSRKVAYGLLGALALMYTAAFSGWRIRKRHVRVRREEKEREAREKAEKDEGIGEQVEPERAQTVNRERDEKEKREMANALRAELAEKVNAEKKKHRRVVAEKTEDFEKRLAEMAGDLADAEQHRQSMAADLEKAEIAAEEKAAAEKKLTERDLRLETMKDEVEEGNRAIGRLEKENKVLNRKIEGFAHDFLATTNVAAGDAAVEKRLGVLQLGGALRYDFDASPAIRPLLADTWEEADRIIKKGKVDVVMPWPAMLNDIQRGNAPPLETPMLVYSVKPSIRKRFAALFPRALVGFVNPLLKRSDPLIGAVRMIAAIEAATLFKDENHRLISRDPIMMG
ncbi:MAG: hypothetical protein GY859_36250, partial [Desulfobacterales bacterium]|nr:hypothetical protein [Desulfobacterales bacterium]